MINEILVLLLAAICIHSLFTIYSTERDTLDVPYKDHPLFHDDYDYAFSMTAKLSGILILYTWLSKDRLYQNIPPDSIGFMFYEHCCCGCKVFTLCAPKLHRTSSLGSTNSGHSTGDSGMVIGDHGDDDAELQIHDNPSVTGQDHHDIIEEEEEEIEEEEAIYIKKRSVRFQSVVRRNSDGETVTFADAGNSDPNMMEMVELPNQPTIQLTISRESQRSNHTNSNPTSPSASGNLHKTTTFSSMPRPDTAHTITGFDGQQVFFDHDHILSPEQEAQETVPIGSLATESGRIFNDRLFCDGFRTRTSSKYLSSRYDHSAQNTMSNTDVSPGQSWYEAHGTSLPTYNEQVPFGRGLAGALNDHQSPLFGAKMKSLGAISDIQEENPRGQAGSTQQVQHRGDMLRTLYMF